MSQQSVTVRLNQQQLELLDRTVTEHPGSSRTEIIRRALSEYREDDDA